MMPCCSEGCTTGAFNSAGVQDATHAVCGTGREGMALVPYRTVHLRMTIEMVHIMDLYLQKPSTDSLKKSG